MAKGAKSVPRGACALEVHARRVGQTFYDAPVKLPVSWRGRDAAARLVKRPKYAHAVLLLDCGPAGKKAHKRKAITLVECQKGTCSVLGGSSNKMLEHRHRGKAAYNRLLAGF